MCSRYTIIKTSLKDCCGKGLPRLYPNTKPLTGLKIEMRNARLNVARLKSFIRVRTRKPSCYSQPECSQAEKDASDNEGGANMCTITPAIVTVIVTGIVSDQVASDASLEPPTSSFCARGLISLFDI